MKYLKKISLSLLCVNFLTVILTVFIYRHEIILHFNAYGNEIGSPYNTLFMLFIPAVFYILSTKLKPIGNVDENSIQIFQYRLPINVTKTNVKIVCKRICEFMDELDLVIQLVFVWGSLVILAQRNVLPWMSNVLMALIIAVCVISLYRIWRAAYKLY